MFVVLVAKGINYFIFVSFVGKIDQVNPLYLLSDSKVTRHSVRTTNSQEIEGDNNL